MVEKTLQMSRRGFGGTLMGVAALAAAPQARAQAPQAAGAINIATIGEPGPLDPTLVTSDLISIITQHIFETLYTFDGSWQIRPLLAEGMPAVSEAAKVYSFKLRSGVHFHDGSPMGAKDVVASLQRWLEISPRGKQVAPYVDTLAEAGPLEVKLTLKRPYAPLLALLAMNNGAAAIMPAAQAATREMLKTYTGTGPYRFAEHKPDQYIRLARFDAYASPAGKADGYAGERRALIGELRFVPVPNPTTRVDGVLAGQYQFADSLPAEMLARLHGHSQVAPITVKPFGFPLMIFNNKTGPMANPLLRQAAQAALSCSDMLAAAFGDSSFFDAIGSIYTKATPYFDAPPKGAYNAADAKRAAALLKQAGYARQPIRIMTSQQYDFLYKMSLVAQQNLTDAGFNVDLQVLDWATLLQKRGDANAWEAFFTYHTFVPEPSLITIFNPAYPGWWDNAEKNAAMDAFNGEADPVRRAAAWKKLQGLFFSQAPAIKVGEFYNLAARSAKLTGYTVTPWPFFWNVRI